MLFQSIIVPNGPPHDFTIAVTSTIITLSWSPPLPAQRNGIITSYLINCTIGGIERIIRQNKTIHTFFTKPVTSYSCTVSAATHIGDGPATAVISGVTDEDSKLLRNI